MPPHPRHGKILLGHLGRTHTHHHDHIRRSRHRIRRFELRFGCRTVVCTSSSAARAAMGHWGQCPHTPGMAGHCLVTLGGHTHTTTTTFGAPDTVFDRSNCGWGVVQWCAHHLQLLGTPWGSEGYTPTSQGWLGTAGSPWGDHTHPNTTAFGVADTVFDRSNCGSGVVRWCAHHPQHLGL